MARPKSADYDAQRDAILATAIESFAELGFAGASIADLAAASGASKARFYHYYDSKQAVLFDALDRYTKRLIVLCQQVKQRRLAPQAELRELLRAFMAEYRDSRPMQIALLNDLRHLPPAQQSVIQRQQRAVITEFAATLERVFPGRFGPGERTPATMALLGAINFTFAWLKPDGALSDADYADLVADLWLACDQHPIAAAKAPQRVQSARRKAR